MIRHEPRTTVSNQRKRKARKCELLSSSPYKNSLQEKLREKATEDGEKKEKCNRTAVRRKLVDKAAVSLSNIMCPICGEGISGSTRGRLDSVTDVRNGGMKLVQLTNQAS
jgi:hypothetical protein